MKINQSKIPPHDVDFEGKVDFEDVIDALIKTLQDFRKRKDHVVKLNFTSSMFHMKLDIKLEKK
ncbi:MAG: hypothetical protein QQN44_06225 [Nitrosopumilus sp.]